MERLRDKKIISPEELGKKILNWFTKERKLALIVAFVSGVIIHFQLYSQEITNPDGLWSILYKMSGTWEVSIRKVGTNFL